MIPVLPVIGAAFIGYALWGFVRRRKRKTGPDTNWQNLNHLAMEESGSWEPDSTISTSSDTAPFRNPGAGFQ